MNENRRETLIGLLIMLTLAGLTTTICLAIFMPIRYDTIETEYNIWYIDAPFGRAYSDTSAEGSIIGSAPIYTSPGELYTIKYLDEDQVKTILLSSTADNVKIYINQNETSVTKIEYHGYNIFGISLRSYYTEIWIINLNITED